MKKLFTLIAATFITVSLFTSCDDYWDDPDYDEAYTLEGVWTGYISDAYYNYRYGSYADWNTEIRFFRGDGYSGTGDEYDYNRYTNTYQYYTFDWEVYNGCIYLYFGRNDVIVIDRYYLDNYSFEGYFTDYYDGAEVAYFSLGRAAWVDYGYYDYGYYDWGYYAKKNNIVTPRDSAMRADSVAIKSKVSENK